MGTIARHGRSVGAPSLLWTPPGRSSFLAFFLVYFFFEVPAFTTAALELNEELDDEDVLELELEESESEASEAPELLPTFSSRQM